MTEFTPPQVATPDDMKNQPEEFQDLVRKIVVSHAINELYGAQVFDEPAIAYAPTPYAKWLTCRVAMEEYGHIPSEQMTPASHKPLSIFEFPLKTWEEFCVIKLLADLAEILQVEDLLHCTFQPLRNLARMTMPEERFHAQFGKDLCTDMCKTDAGRAKIQAAIDNYFPYLPAFFGRAKSRNNARYRHWGIKQRSNEEMRADFVERARALVEDHLKLKLPPVPEAA